jgi:hypothetical protein
LQSLPHPGREIRIARHWEPRVEIRIAEQFDSLTQRLGQGIGLGTDEATPSQR